MILTEETHYGINRLTMEDSRSGSEEPVFGQDGVDNEVAATRANTPAGWTSNTTAKVSKLSKAGGHSIGPNVLLKVMAGDTLNAMADYYYDAPVTNNSNPLLGDIVAGLLQAITGSSAVDPLIHGNLTAISGDLGSSVPLGSIVDPDKGTVDNIPRAYLSVIFFNERFEFIEESSTARRVSQPGNGAAPIVLPNIQAPKNGYAYIYLSNQNDQPVYFDNFAVSDKRGRIIEENHYYAFGLRIAGISSKKFDGGLEGSLKNDYLYNDKELWDDGDLNWYDYGFRNYDAQIARFTQLDPLTWDYPELTNYQYASNDPILNIDLDGLEGQIANKADWFLNKAGDVAKKTLPGVVVKMPDNIVKNILPTFFGNMANIASVHSEQSIVDSQLQQSVMASISSMNQRMYSQPQLGPTQNIVRSKKEQRRLNRLSEQAEVNAIRADREKAPAYGYPLIGDLLTASNRLYHGDIGGSISPAIMFGLNFPVGGMWGAAKTSSNVLLNTSKQLQAKFKHAGDFGVVGNYSKANAGKFSSAINQHINSAGVKVIQGTYHKQPAIHYLNPNTGLNVISTPSGQFWSGWKLSPAQLQNVLKHGGL